jgi:hypothetical protein
MCWHQKKGEKSNDGKCGCADDTDLHHQKPKGPGAQLCSSQNHIWQDYVKELEKNLNSDSGLVGAFVFEWNDEWRKGYSNAADFCKSPYQLTGKDFREANYGINKWHSSSGKYELVPKTISDDGKITFVSVLSDYWCQAANEQCGGKGWFGKTCCVPGTTCESVKSKYYSQCVPIPTTETLSSTVPFVAN